LETFFINLNPTKKSRKGAQNQDCELTKIESTLANDQEYKEQNQLQ